MSFADTHIDIDLEAARALTIAAYDHGDGAWRDPTMEELIAGFKILMDSAVDHPDFKPLEFQAALMGAITSSVDSMSSPPSDPVHSGVQSETPIEEE